MWRKVLQVYNPKKIIFSFTFFTGLFLSSLFSQSLQMPDMPQMPSMTQLPSMPSISESGTFYSPNFPSSSVSGKKKSEKEENATQKGQAVLTESNSSDSILNSLLSLNDSNTLTASDISSLYDSGLFNNLSALNTSNTHSSYSTGTSTNVILQEILNTLNDLKEKQNNAPAKEKEELHNTQSDLQNFKTREPSILRFKINGYNINSSLTKVFFSEPDADGSFLLTADRKYFSNQKAMTETFYMLFKTLSSNGSSVTYSVQPAIVQDTKNPGSFVYKLMSLTGLKAEKTGNLVVMHVNEENLTADLLLDIDKK